MPCHDCENEITEIFGYCSGCGEHICEECSTDMTVALKTCPTLCEAGISLGLIEDDEGDFRCGFCLYSLLADILSQSKDSVRERVIEEILNEVIYFNDDLVHELIFPEGEEEEFLRDPDTFDWTKYNRFVDDPFDLIQPGDQVRYGDGAVCEYAVVISKKDGKVELGGGKMVPSSRVVSVDRNDPNWYRIHEGETFNRTVWHQDQREHV